MRFRTVLTGVGVVAVSFALTLLGFQLFAPQAMDSGPKPATEPLAPLPPAQSVSSIVAPISIPLAVIRDAAERGAPKGVNGRVDNPAPQLIQNADIQWTVQRGALALSGMQDTLALTAPLNGTLNATGSVSGEVQNAIGSALGSLFGGNAAKQLGSINIKQINANADIRGSVAVQAKPQLTANWRLEPGLAAQVNLSESSLNLSGVRLNVGGQVKPVIDRTVNEQLAAVQQRIRNDPALEDSARREWAKICRSIQLQTPRAATLAGTAAMPDLWLEMKPTRAVAAQPRVDANAVTLTLGLEAETRITSAKTTPECPFPATLTIVPPSAGQVKIGMPIDLPFTEVDRIVQAQIVGKTFPEDGKSAVTINVKRASVTPSGDRLLISMLVSGSEKKSFMGFGGEATIHIWGNPALDRAQQVLRLTDVQLAIESEAVFGLLGSAAKIAMPYLQRALAERAVIDLKPIAADARDRVAAVLAELQKDDNGVKVTADVSVIRLAAIAFDAKTLRVIAEAEGAVNATITAIRAP
jgi:hypothetical protein